MSEEKIYSWECPHCGCPAKGFRTYLRENVAQHRSHCCAMCRKSYLVGLEGAWETPSEWTLTVRKCDGTT